MREFRKSVVLCCVLLVTLRSTQFSDAFPWVAVSGPAALMGDTDHVNKYVNLVQTNYVNTGLPYPWYCAEAGWFMRVNNYMLGRRPF
jgi:hypothetical protein